MTTIDSSAGGSVRSQQMLKVLVYNLAIRASKYLYPAVC